MMNRINNHVVSAKIFTLPRAWLEPRPRDLIHKFCQYYTNHHDTICTDGFPFRFRSSQHWRSERYSVAAAEMLWLFRESLGWTLKKRCRDSAMRSTECRRSLAGYLFSFVGFISSIIIIINVFPKFQFQTAVVSNNRVLKLSKKKLFDHIENMDIFTWEVT